MTVRASNIAFFDLRGHYRPWFANHEQPDVLTFGHAVTVIELQRDDVAFTAINAGMRTQVSTQKTPVFRSAAASAINFAGDVLGAIV